MFRKYQNKFYIKNFYKDIGLSPHFTVKGFIKRIERRYPTTKKIITATSTFLITTLVSLVLIPGSILPFQKQLKLCCVHRMNELAQFWTMASFNPHPLKYLTKLQRNLQYAWTHNLITPQEVGNLLDIQNKVVCDQNYTVSNRIRLQLIFNYTKFLSVMLLSIYRTQIMKSAIILQKYRQLVDISILKIKESQINEDCKPMYLLSFKIFEYLLKYSQSNDEKLQILQKLYKFIKIRGEQQISPEYGYIARQFPSEDGIKNQMKTILQQSTANLKIKHAVSRILAEVDYAIQQQQIHNSKQK